MRAVLGHLPIDVQRNEHTSKELHVTDVLTRINIAEQNTENTWKGWKIGECQKIFPEYNSADKRNPRER
jgi:hypothetical protein